MGQIVCLNGAWPSLPSFALPFLMGLGIGQLHLWAREPLSAQPATHHPVASCSFLPYSSSCSGALVAHRSSATFCVLLISTQTPLGSLGQRGKRALLTSLVPSP